MICSSGILSSSRFHKSFPLIFKISIIPTYPSHKSDKDDAKLQSHQPRCKNNSREDLNFPPVPSDTEAKPPHGTRPQTPSCGKTDAVDSYPTAGGGAAWMEAAGKASGAAAAKEWLC